MKRQQGFTLIELVAVIVLLGILAVTALPRFVNLQSDARASVLNGIAASMQSAGAQVYAKSLIQGQDSAGTATITDYDGGGHNVEVAFGYPQAQAAAVGAHDIRDTLVIDKPEIEQEDAGAATTIYVGYDRNNDNDIDGGNCYVEYMEPTAAGTLPAITVHPGGC